MRIAHIQPREREAMRTIGFPRSHGDPFGVRARTTTCVLEFPLLRTAAVSTIGYFPSAQGAVLTTPSQPSGGALDVCVLSSLFSFLLRRLFWKDALSRRWHGNEPSLSQDPGHRIARLRADGKPVLDPLEVESHVLVPVFARDGIVMSHHFQVTSVPRRTCFGHEDPVKRQVLRAGASQTPSESILASALVILPSFAVALRNKSAYLSSETRQTDAHAHLLRLRVLHACTEHHRS